MSNFLLSDLPVEVMGLPIRTDFRVWIAFEEILSNPINIFGNAYIDIVNMIFKEKPQDYLVAFNELISFFNMYEEVESSGDSERLFSWECDSKKVYTAFMRTYGINLKTIEYMHVWEFKTLMSDLCDCNLTTHMQYRGIDLSKYDGDRRSEMAELKAKFAIK